MAAYKTFWIASSLSLLAMTTGCASGYKTPSVSNNPHSMSADTLCYRAAYAKDDPAVQEEIAARGLDCAENLSQQPPVGESRW